MNVVVLGAGPAGLAAAYDLARRGERPLVLEKSTSVGGISRTVEYRGFYFDLGGHRFFTRFDEVQALWEEVLGEAFLVRPRLSRILYGGRLFDYPLRPGNALRNLGAVEAARCVASFARASLRPRGGEVDFEQWVSNRFGDRLFDIFFRSYTEKVWGIPTREIGADWASQRIKNLDLRLALRDARARPFRRGGAALAPTLIDEFHYPRTGPGLMYDTMAAKLTAMGGTVERQADVVRIEHADFEVRRVFIRRAGGAEEAVEGDQFLSSIPLTLLVRALTPAAPEEVLRAAAALSFRHLVTVDLIVDHPDLFPDNWIYVHEPQLQLGRVQNFKNWSPHMVPDARLTSLGLEYFCSDGDALWNADHDALIALGKAEIARTGLTRGARVLDGTVVRVPRAYPVYRRGYEQHLDVIVAWLRRFRNLQTMGRYGMFKYNNADHSILTALLCVENLHGAAHDVWRVNTDTAYHEIRGEGPR
jgi:protoporphyrinogen oxidase